MLQSMEETNLTPPGSKWRPWVTAARVAEDMNAYDVSMTLLAGLYKSNPS
jgi:hypothetical protein